MRNKIFIKSIPIHLIKQEMFNIFQARDENSHKGTFGSLAIVGGFHGMEGALILAGKAALKMGCGKVFLSFVQDQVSFSYIVEAPEIMLRPYRDLLTHHFSVQAMAIGCGLSTQPIAYQVLDNVLKLFRIPMILDADALNIISLKKIKYQLEPDLHVITPHPVEAARLLGVTVQDIQNDRFLAAKQIAEKYHVVVVLKGHQTIVFSPLQQESVYFNPTGNSGLATAGTGDVLSGIIGSLLAQGFSTFESAKAGVFLHGLAADRLVSEGIGPIGMTASEIAESARWLRNEITYNLL